jgi:hypothetical protein
MNLKQQGRTGGRFTAGWRGWLLTGGGKTRIGIEKHAPGPVHHGKNADFAAGEERRAEGGFA